MGAGLMFLFNNVLLGWGLAMDAFSVSVVNGLNEPHMRLRRRLAIAGTFAFFQWFMPMTGWVCVRTVMYYFSIFERAVPWIALALLAYIGGSMVLEGVRKKDGEKRAELTSGGLFVQGVATSIDALSVGFAIAEYSFAAAFWASVIIAAVTFAICMSGVQIGRTVGAKLSDKASVLGGLILIGIGIEIFVTNVF